MGVTVHETGSHERIGKLVPRNLTGSSSLDLRCTADELNPAGSPPEGLSLWPSRHRHDAAGAENTTLATGRVTHEGRRYPLTTKAVPVVFRGEIRLSTCGKTQEVNI
jgi:hypothetical protein